MRIPAWSGFDSRNSTDRGNGLLMNAPRFGSRNGCYGIFGQDRADHSALMLADRITLPHFSVSEARSFPKLAGVIVMGTLPRSASRAFIPGSVRAALISLLSLSTISVGVFLGAPRPVS